MARILAGLIVFAIVAAAVIGAGAASRSLLQAQEIRIQMARQEAARAQVMEAQADSARAAAARAWSDAAAWRATESDRAAAIRAAVYGTSGAIVILALGAAMALASWLQLRARTLAPSAAGWPILVERQQDGALAVIDTARLAGPVAIVCQDGQVIAPILASEDTTARLATQAQAAAVLLGVAKQSKTGAAETILERVNRTAEKLPAPQFTTTAPPAAADGDGLRLVYVHEHKSEASLELAELREMIQQASIRGLARQAWIGDGQGRRAFVFDTRRECNRARYDRMIDQLQKAGVIEPAGRSWRLAVTEGEALAAFGMEAELRSFKEQNAQ